MFKSVAAGVVFLLFINFVNVNGWRTFTINLSNATSTVHSNKANMNMTVKNNSMTAYFNINERIAHIIARAEIFLQSPDTGRYDMELVNRTIDLCKLFKNSLYEPLVQIIYGIILAYGDFPTSCPINPRLYYIKNMYVDAEKFPPYLPERKGYVRMLCVAVEKGLSTTLAEINVHFVIKNSALNRFLGAKSRSTHSLF